MEGSGVMICLMCQDDQTDPSLCYIVLAPAALYAMYKISAVMPHLYSLIKLQVILFTSLQVKFFY